MQGIVAATLVLASAQDFHDPAFCARAAAAAIPGGRFAELPGDDGYRSASGVSAAPTAVLGDTIAAFMGLPLPRRRLAAGPASRVSRFRTSMRTLNSFALSSKAPR